jgi:uncharacterized protein
VLRLGLAALVFFVALVAVMAWSQDDMLFPTHAVPPPDPLPQGAERLSLDIPAGETLHGVHIPPAEDLDGRRTLVLGFGGNAWNAQNVATYLHQLYPGAHVAAFHYRGFSPSTGRPSAKALLADAPLVLDSAIGRVEPEHIVVAGFSIGSAVAASLARRPDVHGAILVTPFDSLTAVAGDLYPWLPVGLLFRHEMNAAEYLEDSKVPVAIIAAQRDDIIPSRRTQALRAKVGNLVYDRTIAGAGHNDLYAHSQFRQAMREAFAVLMDAGERSGSVEPKNRSKF